MYGSNTTASNFNAMRAQRRQILQRNSERGLSGVLSGLSKAQDNLTDEQRMLKQEMN